MTNELNITSELQPKHLPRECLPRQDAMFQCNMEQISPTTVM